MSFHASSTRVASVALDRRRFVLAAGLLGLAAAVVIGIAVGPVYLGPGIIWRALVGDPADISNTIVDQIRLPRVLVAAMIGSNLAIAGALLQGVTRNPLADPHIFGISGGASLVAVTAIVFFPDVPRGVVQPLAFAGGVTAGGLAYVMSWRGGVSPARLALAGIAVTSMLTAISSALLVTSSFSAQIGMRWLIGGLLGRNWDDVRLLAPYFFFGTAVALIMARQVNVIALGDEIATSLGQHVERTRVVLVAIAALLASSAVSIGGLIGFVGLIVPHLVRLAIGNDYRLLIPCSALFGAILLILADTLARTILDPSELPVGVFTAVLGGPVFILLVRRRA